ncbi:lipoprotein YteS [Bacillus sonorensis]|uniref:lipoprotein YteS n=1 Tax=Bacillus sonorensis TaxID=119858 RepID=UPI003D1E734D
MKKTVFLTAVMMLLTSCGKADSARTDVFIFSDASAEISGNIEKAAGKQHLSAKFFPASPEKLLVEIAAKEGDLYIVPEEMFKPFFDPEGLRPLGSHPGDGEPYTAAGSDGEKRLNGYTFQLNTDMAAFIPIYAKKTDEAMDLIEALRGQ